MHERILLIDDDRSVHEIVRPYLEHDGYIVDSCLEGRRGVELSHGHSVALLLVDLVLPDMSGIEILRVVRRNSELPIIMLSGQAGTEDRVEALIAGADDYVMKPFSPRELAARVQSLLRRAGSTKDVSFFDEGALEIDHVRHEVRIAGTPCELTVTEYEILAALAAHPGRVYSRSELTYHSRGHDYEGYERTVDAHVKNLRRKIEPDPAAPRFVETVRGVGYRLGVRPS